jgi:hypothetical protein
VGKFERFSEGDIAFVCDFCDGFIVWEDLQNMPAARTPLPAGDTQPNWQARGNAVSAATQPGDDDGEKTVVYAPLAIANHLPPLRGDWLARLTCPYCDEYTYVGQGDDEVEETNYVQDESGFHDLQAFQEHLEWHHTSLQMPAMPSKTPTCVMM